MAKTPDNNLSRREFIRIAGIGGIGAFLSACGLMSADDAKKMAEATRQAAVATSQTDVQRGFAQANGEATRASVAETRAAAAQSTIDVRPTAAPATATRVATRPATVAATRPAVTVPMQEIFKAKDALAYPALIVPNPAREPAFPDVAQNGHGPLVAYEQPFANADYFHTGKGEVSVPQYYYRLITGRHITISGLGVDVSSNARKGALVLVVNHFGETATYPNSTAENSFTVAGRVFDMGSPDKVTKAAQALLDHNIGRMVNSPDGANCSVIDACQQVEWHVVVIGGGKPQEHWAGLYTKGQ